MLLTVALVVLCSSIFVLFSKEFGNLIKKIFTIPGTKLLLPLVLITTFYVLFEPWAILFILKLKALLHLLVAAIESLIPFTWAADFVANLLVLITFTLLPVFALNAWCIKKTYVPFKYPYLLSTILWLFIAVLLVAVI